MLALSRGTYSSGATGHRTRPALLDWRELETGAGSGLSTLVIVSTSQAGRSMGAFGEMGRKWDENSRAPNDNHGHDPVRRTAPSIVGGRSDAPSRLVWAHVFAASGPT
ncbi:hypothetical protein VDGL01_08983 [Verticillium dahliae]